MQYHQTYRPALTICLGLLLAVAGLLALTGSRGLAAPAYDKPQPPVKTQHPASDQIIYGFPLTITVSDDTQMDIRYRDPNERQFYGGNAEGAYLWVNVGGVTTVFGPPGVPAGRSANPYTPISNVKTGSGTPSDPWLVTTVNDVPGTNLRLIQQTTYVNGAEFTNLQFTLQQIGGSAPITATLFHAADLYTAGSDQGYGYYDPSTHGVGDYFTRTNGVVLYQEFVPNPNSPLPTAYKESYYNTIWANIGDTSGPGPGFDNTIISDTLHDAGVGLQWNLTVPGGGAVAVGDTDLFSPHASLCGSFSDVPEGSYYYEFVYYLACRQIISGYSDTTFRPNYNTTRGQLAKIAANSAGFTDPPVGQTFEDVPPTNAFYPYIQRMATRNLISGYACGGANEPCVPPGNRPYFRWTGDVTRGQLTKILANAAGYVDVIPSTQQTFEDVPSSNAFWLYIERMAGRSLISGYTCGGAGEPCVPPGNRSYFRWAANATRGQVAKIDKLTFFP